MTKIHIATLSHTLCGRQVHKRLQPMVAGWGTLAIVTCLRCRDAMQNKINETQTFSNATGVMTYREISPPLTNKRSCTKFVLRKDLLRAESADKKCKITHVWTAEQNISAKVVNMTVMRWLDKRYYWCVMMKKPFPNFCPIFPTSVSNLRRDVRSIDGFAYTLQHAKVFCDESALKLVEYENVTNITAGKKQ